MKVAVATRVVIMSRTDCKGAAETRGTLVKRTHWRHECFRARDVPFLRF